jgi:hypothetical protein
MNPKEQQLSVVEAARLRRIRYCSVTVSLTIVEAISVHWLHPGLRHAVSVTVVSYWFLEILNAMRGLETACSAC